MKMSARRGNHNGWGNVWKKAFMTNKAVAEKNSTDEELELIQNTDPASDPADAPTTGVDEEHQIRAVEEGIASSAACVAPSRDIIES